MNYSVLRENKWSNTLHGPNTRGEFLTQKIGLLPSTLQGKVSWVCTSCNRFGTGSLFYWAPSNTGTSLHFIYYATSVKGSVSWVAHARAKARNLKSSGRIFQVWSDKFKMASTSGGDHGVKRRNSGRKRTISYLKNSGVPNDKLFKFESFSPKRSLDIRKDIYG